MKNPDVAGADRKPLSREITGAVVLRIIGGIAAMMMIGGLADMRTGAGKTTKVVTVHLGMTAIDDTLVRSTNLTRSADQSTRTRRK